VNGPLEFRILGPFEVGRNGEPLEIPAGKPRALLAVLLLRAGEVVSLDTFVDGLWGEQPPATAAKNVQVYVARLRRALGDGVLVTQAPGYALRVDPEQFDAARFQALVEEARLEEPARAAPRLEKAHPLRERLQGLLLLALYRCGRQADALEAYRGTRRRFVEELGVEPSPALRQLERAILEQDPSLEPPPRHPSPVPVQRIGRRGVLVAGVLALGGLAAILTAAFSGGRARSLVALPNSIGVVDGRHHVVRTVIKAGGEPGGIEAGA